MINFNKSWELSVGFYPGVLFGIRSYTEKEIQGDNGTTKKVIEINQVKKEKELTKQQEQTLQNLEKKRVSSNSFDPQIQFEHRYAKTFSKVSLNNNDRDSRNKHV